MKKTLFALFGLVVLTGCSTYFDYYKGGVRYTQDGEDCIFYAAERGRHYSDDIRSLNTDKKIVYRNTMCRDLYLRDNMGVASTNARQILVPAAATVSETPICSKCNKCATKKKYVFVK
ncbi:MAG: membrane lipoprotein lipid attachment site-containing protein [Alphaproteobacteria bacterium]|nr:membrane lipoprotein lipid attachment site-containing protein [Alphaproteobacteria bacterium]